MDEGRRDRFMCADMYMNPFSNSATINIKSQEDEMHGKKLTNLIKNRINKWIPKLFCQFLFFQPEILFKS